MSVQRQRSSVSEHRHQWFKTYVYDQGTPAMFSRCPACGVADSERGATRDIFTRRFGTGRIPRPGEEKLNTMSDYFPSWAERGAVMTEEQLLAHTGVPS